MASTDPRGKLIRIGDDTTLFIEQI